MRKKQALFGYRENFENMRYIDKDIQLDEKKGSIKAAFCTCDNGFEFAYNTMSRGGILTVIDSRRAETDPVAVICNYTATTINDIEATVGMVIRLYKAHQVISIARNIEEFEETFRKIA